MEYPDTHKKRTLHIPGIRFCAFVLAYMISQSIYGQCNLTVVNAESNVAICIGASKQLTTIQSGAVDPLKVTYSWTPITGLNNANIANPVASPNSTTSYTVTATEGTCTATANVIVTVNQLPIANFDFSPDNQCSPMTVAFTNLSTGSGSYNSVWDFGDTKTSTLKDPANSFSATAGNGTQSFNVKLTVNEGLNCFNSITKPVIVKQSPDATLGSTSTSGLFNGVPVFKVCSNSVSIFTFNNSSSTASTNTHYTIKWGDGSPDFESTSWNTTTHTYQIGLWNVVYTIVGQNGCSISKSYIVFVGSNPKVSFGTPGNTDICISSSLVFPISDIENNPPGTTYTVTFNDGSAPQIFNHPPPTEVTHTFLKSSCGTTSSDGSNSYPNSFSANIVAKNPCGTSSIGVVPIYVSTPPVANFTLPSSSVCINNQTCFTNASYGANEIIGEVCNASSKLIWSISPATGYSINNGSVPGNDFGTSDPSSWITGTNSICPIFTQAGTYIITLKTANRCGSDTKVQTIFVKPLPTATISGTTNVCLNASSPLITFTGANGTAPYTFTYNINGGANKAVTTTSGNSVSVSALTNASGAISYNLVNVKEGGSTACSQLQTGVATVQVIPLPAATISGTTSVCLNSASPFISFTGANGTAPYTFTYNIDGGANQTVTTTSGNSVSVSAPTGTPGIFNYNLVNIQDASPTVCSQSPIGSATVIVKPLPTAAISGTTSVCMNVASPLITFKGANGTGPYIFTYNINGGTNQTVTTTSGNSITVSAPTNTAGTFNYNLISVKYSGATACPQTQLATATVTIIPQPTATISGTASVCLNSASPVISFTGANGTAPYTFNYNINGGSTQTVTTTSGNSITVSAPTSTPGTFNYNLVSIQDAGTTACPHSSTGAATISVNPLPTATISGTASVCLNSASPFITFTGAKGTAPYTFTYNIDGGPNQTVTTTSGNSVTVSAPTNAIGTFNYNLISVQYSGTTACPQLQTGAATITVNGLPTAAISGTTNVCLNAISPFITFTGSNGTAPYTFTYNINGGANKFVTTTSGNSVTVSALTNTSGAFSYNLVSVKEGGSIACSQSQTGVATVQVIPLPTATISGAASVCLNSASPFITFTGANGTAPYTFTYNIDGAPGQTVTTTSGNSVSVSAPTSITGTFNYNLVSIHDAGANACSQSQTSTSTITVYPIPTVDQPINFELCNGLPTSVINFSGNIASTTFTWSNSNSSIGIIGIGTGNIPSFIPVNLGISPINSTITVTPIANGCSGPSKTFTITVNPSPNVTFSSKNQTICSGESTTLVTLNSTTTGVTFEWSAVFPNGITVTDIIGTNTIPVQTLENITNVPLVVTYKAKASLADGAGCAGAESVYTITVNPKPSVKEKFTTTICSGSTFTVSPLNGNENIVPPGTTYTWSTPVIFPDKALTGPTAQRIPQTNVSQALTNNTNDIATAIYQVTPLSGECSGLPFEVIVTINPTPLVDMIGDKLVCDRGTNPKIDITGAVPGTAYKWVNSNTSIGLGASGSGFIPAFTAINVGTAPKIATITITPSANGCIGLSRSFTITIYPLLPVSILISSDANNICPGTAVTYTAIPTNGGLNPTYQWKVNGIDSGTVGASYAYAPVDGDKIESNLISNAVCPSGSPAQSNVISMVVFSSLPAGVTIVESANNICPGESSTFIATAFNGGSNPVFQWFVNSARVGTNQAVYSYDPVDGDVVSCQLLSSNSCSSNGVAASTPIKMFVSPPALQPSFVIEQLNECAPIKVLLKNNSLPGGLAYIWDFGDGTADTTATPIDISHTFENFTTSTIEFTVSLKIVTRFTHCFNILTKKIIVRPELFAGSPVNYMGCSPFVQRFENAYAGAKSYRWIDSRKKLLSDKFQPTLTFTTTKGVDSTHIVYLIAESFFGCYDTIVNTIKVSPALAMPSFTYSGKADCRSVTYTFKNTSPEGAKVFVWDFNDGTINKTYHANEVVTHTFMNGLDVAVPFNVSLTSSSGNSCSLSITQKIMVDPEYTAGFPVTFQGCSPLIRKFMNAYDGSKSYQWKSSDWKLLSNEISPTFTFNALPGRDSTCLVYLITESLNGCIDTVINKVIVRAADKAAFSAIPTEGCAPLLVQFTNASSPKTNGYQWDFGDGSDYSVVESPRHIFIDADGLESKYKVSLVAFNQYGCADTTFHEIHLLPTPQVDFVAQPIVQSYPERTVKLTNLTPPGNWTYSWNLGDQKPSVAGLLSDYTYDLPGEYVISLTAKGSQCENTKRVKVTINPGTPLASFEPDTSGCAPLRVNFRNNSQNGSRYQWDFGNGTQSVDFSPSTTYFDEGAFTVKLKVFNQFGVMSETVRRIVVHPVPKALFKPLPYRVRIPAQAVTFFNSSENSDKFLWDFGDGGSSSEFQPSHQYTLTGLFNVRLTITSAEGCKDTFLLPGAVDAFSDGLKVPNAFMPNKEGPNDGYYEAGDPRNHIFYPSVAVGDLIDYELMIYNRWGNLLFVTKEAERGWDGYYNGILCPQDVYVWKIRCKFKSGSNITKTGDVTLIQ